MISAEMMGCVGGVTFFFFVGRGGRRGWWWIGFETGDEDISFNAQQKD